MPDLAAAAAPDGAEHEASNERGDEAGAADRVCNSESQTGAGQRHDLEPGTADEPVLPGDEHDERGGHTRNHPGQDAVTDLLQYQPNRSPIADGPRLVLRYRQDDPEQRHTNPVVEAALDVQSLSHPARKALQRDDRLTERRVRRGEDHRKEQRFGPRQLRE